MLPRLVVFGVLFLCGSGVVAACGPGVPRAVPTATPKPGPRVELPTVPAGFRITLISEQLKVGTALTLDDKYFYAAELHSGNVLRLADTNGDGLLDEKVVMARDFEMPRYLALHPKTGELYVSSRGQINVLRDTNGDGAADENRVVIDGLYDLDFMHSNNGIAFGPDGKLYIADGAPRLRRIERRGPGAMEPFAGTVLVANPDGSELRVYARGFRNPFGLAFADDGSLYATDNGEDSIPKPFHGDELNRIVENGHFGYPEVLGDPPAGSDTIAPLVNFPADSAPTDVVVYDAAQFPADYRGNVFVALWNIGHKVVRAWQAADGAWQTEDLVTKLKFPVSMTLGADGSLYILDMADGVDGVPGLSSRIYRLEYAP
jgi:putative membrane-bound dehydrogenase-like protein